MIIFLYLKKIDRELETIGHHNNAPTSHPQVELGDVRQENNRMNPGIVVVVANKDLKLWVDRMKIAIGVYVKEHV
jgi:hypothetical protein